MTARRRYHFGLPGILYVLVTLFLAIGASNSQNNLLFLAFSISIGAGVASGIISGLMMMGVTVERSLPPASAVGSAFSFRYTIHNRNRFLPLFAVIVEESAEPAGRRDSTPTWRRLMPSPRAALLHLGPRDSIEVSASIVPTRRGVATFSGVMLSSSFPFGLVRKSVTFKSRASIVVAPRSERLRRDATSNLLSRAESGLASAASLGRGDEFYGVRDYVPGDSPRLISWKASARTGSLVVREQTTPTAGNLWVILNLNAPRATEPPPPDDPTEQAIVLATSLIDAALIAGVEVGFAAPDAGVVVAPAAAPRQRPALMSALATIEAARGPGVPPGNTAVAHRAACIVVHAGGVDPSFGPSGAKHLSFSDLGRLSVSKPRSGAAREGRA